MIHVCVTVCVFITYNNSVHTSNKLDETVVNRRVNSLVSSSRVNPFFPRSMAGSSSNLQLAHGSNTGLGGLEGVWSQISHQAWA
ncbi:hypothetical protein Hanom_Chr06g00481201 [Helianthus anomalus]